MSSKGITPKIKYSLIQQYWKIIPVGILICGMLTIVLSLIFNPIFVERYISSDKRIEKATVINIYVFEGVVFFIGLICILMYRYFRIYNKRKEEIVKNSILFTCSIVFTLIISEIALQVVNNYFPFGRQRHYFFQYDEILGWKHKPNKIANFKNTQVKINSKSLRDDEISYSKPASEFRILCLGDSQTFGDGVNEQETFVSLLEKKIRNVQVINAGVIGYGTDQQLLFLKREGIKYSPDLIMVYFNAHDITDNISKTIKSGYYKPRFELKEDKLILTNVPVKKFDIIERINKYISDRSLIYYFLNRSLTGIIDKAILNFNPKLKSGKDEIFEKYTILPHPSKMMYAIDVTKKILKEIAEEGKKIGAKIIIVFLPYEAEFGLSSEYKYAHTKNLYDELIKFGKKEEIIIFDIRTEISTATHHRGIYLDGVHFNVQGHRIIADIIDKRCISLNLIPEKHHIE